MGRSSPGAELRRHFFRRFFESDAFDSDGDTWTTLSRGLAMVAAPGLMFAFFLQNAYPQRSAWGRVQDHYFFVLFSFVVMAGVALFEWEMLFPERLDFLVLTPLPLRPGQMLRAKAAALGCVLAFFLVASNALGVLVLPAISRERFWRMVYAQSVAVGIAGMFGALAVVALGGLLLCVLPPGAFRRVSPGLQMLATASLGLLVIHYARFGDGLGQVLEAPGTLARWVPTFWFLGVYEQLLRGHAAESFASAAANRAWEATGVAVCLSVLLYPLAWVRMRRMAMQGEVTRGRNPARWWAAGQRRWVRAPAERAVFSFIAKMMMRNSRYGVYLAIYGGVGLALSLSCAFTLQQDRLFVSQFGLRAVLPLLLFWTIAGLRIAFGVPQNLPSRWVFRVTGTEAQACAHATRRWAASCGLTWIVAVTALLAAFGWGWRVLLVQAVFGVCFCVVLVQSFFVAQRGAPFTRPRSPGRTSLPAVLTLYVGVLPPLLFGMAWIEGRMEHKLWELVVPVLLTGLLVGSLRWVRERLVWLGDESEGPEGEFQLLGLSGELRS